MFLLCCFNDLVTQVSATRRSVVQAQTSWPDIHLLPGIWIFGGLLIFYWKMGLALVLYYLELQIWNYVFLFWNVIPEAVAHLNEQLKVFFAFIYLQLKVCFWFHLSTVSRSFPLLKASSNHSSKSMWLIFRWPWSSTNL